MHRIVVYNTYSPSLFFILLKELSWLGSLLVWFEISMNYSIIMQVFQRQHRLSKIQPEIVKSFHMKISRIELNWIELNEQVTCILSSWMSTTIK